MKKKISVISLILLFFISTIGLPLSINICSMMGTVHASLCKMNSECENEIYNPSFNSESIKSDCCKTEIIDKSIHDQYLQNNIKKLNLNQYKILALNSDIPVDNSLLISPVKYFNDTSPPPLLNNHIYLSNSVLLI